MQTSCSHTHRPQLHPLLIPLVWIHFHLMILPLQHPLLTAVGWMEVFIINKMYILINSHSKFTTLIPINNMLNSKTNLATCPLQIQHLKLWIHNLHNLFNKMFGKMLIPLDKCRSRKFNTHPFNNDYQRNVTIICSYDKFWSSNTSNKYPIRFRVIHIDIYK